jgi:hypothetical protein
MPPVAPEITTHFLRRSASVESATPQQFAVAFTLRAREASVAIADRE